jgi:NAD(P)H-dependent nitrite reductase small subunit
MIPVCKVGDVPLGEGRRVTILGRAIAVFRSETGWYALDDTCPHRGGPLSDGVLAERSVICPLHERRFELATGEPLSDGCGVAAHAVEVRGEDVFVELAERPGTPQIWGADGRSVAQRSSAVASSVAS